MTERIPAIPESTLQAMIRHEVPVIEPTDYLGDSRAQAEAAVAEWRHAHTV